VSLPRAICILCGLGGPRHRGLEKGPKRPFLVAWTGPPFYIHYDCIDERLAEQEATRKVLRALRDIDIAHRAAREDARATGPVRRE
jgi:hypothetical protein